MKFLFFLFNRNISYSNDNNFSFKKGINKNGQDFSFGICMENFYGYQNFLSLDIWMKSEVYYFLSGFIMFTGMGYRYYLNSRNNSSFLLVFQSILV